MSDGLTLVRDLARDTLAAPRVAARRVMAIGAQFDSGVLWMALILVAILSSILTHLAIAMLPGGEAALESGALGFSPIRTALIQLALMAVFVWAMVTVGRWRGGNGTWPQALSLMVWLQLVLLALQLAQVVALLVFPLLADLIGIAALGLFFVLLTLFVTELHGFRSPGLVFLGILLTMFGAALILSILLVMAGVRVSV